MATTPTTPAPTTPAPEEASEPLKYQKWVLKVSIHCQGCKRKVTKVLKSIDGVYTINIDAQQHKVIVTGDVDANTLVKTLVKTGKHAELWPEEPENKEKKKKKKKKKGKKTEPKSSEEDNSTDSTEEEDNDDGGGGAVKVVVGPDGKVTETVVQQPENSGGGGKKKKKKKKKGNKGNNNPSEGTVEMTGTVGSPSRSGPVNLSPPRYHAYPVHLSPPRQHVYPYPSFNAPPTPYGLPVYGASYNTAYPSTSYGVSYHGGSSSAISYTYQYTPSSTLDYEDDDDYYDYQDHEDSGHGCSIM